MATARAFLYLFWVALSKPAAQPTSAQLPSTLGVDSHFQLAVCSNERPVNGWLSADDVTRPVARGASWDRLRPALSSDSLVAAAVQWLRAASRHWTRVRIGRLPAV